MFKRVYNFLTESKINSEMLFDFRQNLSSNHALINLTENIQALDQGYISCGIFDHLQKAFTIDHKILLAKLNHYGIQGVK